MDGVWGFVFLVSGALVLLVLWVFLCCWPFRLLVLLVMICCCLVLAMLVVVVLVFLVLKGWCFEDVSFLSSALLLKEKIKVERNSANRILILILFF